MLSCTTVVNKISDKIRYQRENFRKIHDKTSVMKSLLKSLVVDLQLKWNLSKVFLYELCSLF